MKGGHFNKRKLYEQNPGCRVCNIAICTLDWLDWKNTGKGRLRPKVLSAVVKS